MKLRADRHDEDVLVDAETGAWAALHQEEGRWIVREGGPSRLWAAVEGCSTAGCLLVALQWRRPR
ncbi:hypothetical protein [Streptomyces sp. KL116D]|uniref:hypothetical protein n=1 Tax=Streptomyces sp. KL116D TaxID=3045152 RepID=UPI00355934A1